MSKYTFTFKKDDIFVDFTTTDKTAVEKQFQIWVNSATEYAQAHPAKNKDVVEAKPSIPEKKFEAPAESKEVKEVKEVQPVQPKEEPKEVVFEQASSLLKTINNIQNPKVEEAPVAENAADAVVDFDTLLEKTIENPTFEPTKVKDQVFLNLINSKNTMDKFHYLMITAYYLSEFEKMQRFSIKQINSKLMNNLSEVIDHTMLQEAINQGFIELLPDLTGTSDVGEYRLTPLGEDFFANKI